MGEGFSQSSGWLQAIPDAAKSCEYPGAALGETKRVLICYDRILGAGLLITAGGR